jgi:cell wall-associated NlpC family hydrolase
VIEIAARYVGVPYLWGGTTPAGFDCSGFTQYVYAQLGISLPRTSNEQRYAGTVVPADQALPGDLIWHPGHIAIYAGGNMIIDAPEPGGVVHFRPIYQTNPVFIRVG